MLTKRSEDGTEELLLSEGVLRRRHGDDERVLADVGLAVGQEVGGGLGHLQGHSTGAGSGAGSEGPRGACASPRTGFAVLVARPGERLCADRGGRRSHTPPDRDATRRENMAWRSARRQEGPESPSSRVSGELGLRASGLAIAL